ncbi:MAG: SlyX family protein [Alphaproteobacteria bacterium]|nr:SlyX family protein [Alphaproteobacteria bacterium]
MEDKILEQRFIDIEINLANQEKMLDELNSVVIEQGKLIDILRKQNKILFEALKEDTVKPLSEETRPPHY